MRIADYVRLLHGNLMRSKLRTGLTMLSVIIGAVAVISVLAATLTVRSVVEQQLAASGALTNITVSSNPSDQGGGPGGGAQTAAPSGGANANRLTKALVSQLAAMPHVLAVSPQLQVNSVMAVSLQGGDGKQYQTQRLVAVVANQAGIQSVQAGRFVHDGEANAIVLSSEYVTSFGLASAQDLVGRTVILYGQPGQSLGTPPVQPGPGQSPGQQQQPQSVQVTATVVGVTAGGQQSGVSAVSQSWGITLDTQYQCAQGAPNSQPQGRPGQPGPGPCRMVAQDPVAMNGYDSIVVKVDTTDSVAGVTSQIKALGVYTQTAQDILDQVSKILTIVGLILGAIGALSLLVATIGIINTMIMATYERRREIGVMRATGASRRTVLTMFTLEAGMIGFWGGMLGLGIALVVRLVGNNILNRVLADQGLAGTDVISFPIWLIAGVVAGTTLLGVVAGVLPAGRAARLDPVEALASGG